MLYIWSVDSEKNNENCCHQMPYFKAKMHHSLGFPDLLAGFNLRGPISEGKERKKKKRREKEKKEKEKEKKGKVKGENRTPSLSSKQNFYRGLVYFYVTPYDCSLYCS